jgi:hypothetical protein
MIGFHARFGDFFYDLMTWFMILTPTESAIEKHGFKNRIVND